VTTALEMFVAMATATMEMATTRTVTALVTMMITMAAAAAAAMMAKSTENNQIKAATAMETVTAMETAMVTVTAGGDETTAVRAAVVVAAVAHCRGCLLNHVKSDTIFWAERELARSHHLSLSHHSHHA
jgi:hypothetical protein